MYDWANSAYITTVVVALYPVFFKQFWCAGSADVVSNARLSAANSITALCVAVAAPVLGAIADCRRSRTAFLVGFALTGAAMSLVLSTIGAQQWLVASVVFVIAGIGFAGANSFYDSLLVDVAPEKDVAFISTLGYSLGYLGGGILLALNVWMTTAPQRFGLASTEQAVRVSFITVGIWWMVFTIPLVLWVKEKYHARTQVPVASLARSVAAGTAQLVDTFRKVRHLKTVGLFLCAYWLYMDGVGTVQRMSVAYGMSIGFDTADLIMALLITQFVGFPSAVGFGLLARRIGDRVCMYIAIGIYIALTIWGACMQHVYEFYVLAAVVGLVQGGLQALSRSFYARIIPPERAGEFFGFYNMVHKASAIIGPVLMGGVGLLVQALGASAHQAVRVSILSVSVLFIAGGVVFSFVKEGEGRRHRAYMA
jgi:UMF1 family MFS transporter